MKKPSQELTAKLGIRYEDIYAALASVGRRDTIANVQEVCRYLETTARDAANSALVDWQEQHKQSGEEK